VASGQHQHEPVVSWQPLPIAHSVTESCHAMGSVMDVRCEVCRAHFVAERRTARFCGATCRQRAYRRRPPKRAVAVFSSERPDWATPQNLFAELDQEHGPFTLDAAATAKNAKVATYFTEADDALQQRWTGRVWMNPPCGKGIDLWMAKAWRSVADGDAELVCCLVPARTCTKWWHDYAAKGQVTFLQGRVHFAGAGGPAPFPSAVVVFERVGR
jgi:phage N-6-adenine-methyltransferase